MSDLEYQRKWRALHPTYNRDRYRAHKAEARAWHIKHKYGLETGQYDSLYAGQNGLCGACSQFSVKKMCVDHDHITGKVRGLLCARCNIVLGMVKDNDEILRGLIGYLNRNAVNTY